jgi:hypothetical protein
MSFDADESYFEDIYPKLKRAIQGLKGADLAQEREPMGKPIRFDGLIRMIVNARGIIPRIGRGRGVHYDASFRGYHPQ